MSDEDSLRKELKILNQKLEDLSKKPPRILAAELLIIGLLLALGFEEMLTTYEFDNFKWPSFFVMLGLVILVVWVAQLVVSWEKMFENVGVDEMPAGGMLHLWILVPYAGLVFLACRYHKNYYYVLLFITLIAILDFIGAMVHISGSNNKSVIELNRKWIKRDTRIFSVLLAIAWVLYLLVDRNSSHSPTIWSATMFLSGMMIAYLSDMWMNPSFYETFRLWRTPKKFWRTISKALKRK